MPSPTPPTAPRRPRVREHHGHRFEDPYAWMSDLEDPGLRAHLAGRTILAITHREAVAAAMDRTIRLDGGRVVEDGTDAVLADEPVSV